MCHKGRVLGWAEAEKGSQTNLAIWVYFLLHWIRVHGGRRRQIKVRIRADERNGALIHGLLRIILCEAAAASVEISRSGDPPRLLGIFDLRFGRSRIGGRLDGFSLGKAVQVEALAAISIGRAKVNGTT